MKHRYIRLSLVILCLLIVLTFLGCNKINRLNYRKISIGMTYNQVINILGIEDEKTEELAYDIYFWYDNADSYDDAVKKVADGQKVKVILIMFSIGSTTVTPKVIDKQMVDFGEYLEGNEKEG